MKKTAFVFLGLVALLGLSSCGNNEEETEAMTLRVYNWEDYISEDPDILEQFEEYVLETDGVEIEVIYNTFDTNETMYSQLETGAATYDLICPSDYMIQRMARNGLLEPFAEGEERDALYEHGTEGWEDTTNTYTSSYLLEQFESIEVEVDGVTHSISEYAKGYMWGTLGLIYNPEYFVEEGDDEEEKILEVKEDMHDWNSLWDEKYQGTFQIKDSMRDTYAVGVMHAYDEELQALLSQYENGELTSEEYNHELNLIFNNIVYPCGDNEATEEEEEAALEEIVATMKESLMALRNNSYGLEVDSGKQDIVTGRTGIGMAWSGDAIWSMDLGDNEEGIELYYSVPETGANIWFDGWCMPSGDDLNKEYAQKFVDFLSRPDIATLNMDAIGYTSFVGGDDVLSLIREWYDPRTYEMYQYMEIVDEDLRATYWEEEGLLYDEETGEPLLQDGSGDEEGYVYDDEYELETDTGTRTIEVRYYVGTSDMTGSDYSVACVDGEEMTWDEYNEENELEWMTRDLSYFFEGTLEEMDIEEAILYTDEIEILEDEDGDEFEVGRQFYAQYPSEEMLPRLCIMEDYGDRNTYVLRLWEDVKAGTIETWVIVVFSVEIAAVLGLVAYFVIRNKRRKAIRKKVREEAAA